MTTSSIIDILNQYGFATIASIGMGWFIYFIYKYVTTEIKKKLGEMSTVLIALIDRVRMLDNDMIRLQQKVNVVLEYRARQEVLEDAEEKEALAEVKKHERGKDKE